MKQELLHSCPELIDYINETGFLPLLSMGIAGWSAEEVTDEDCQYTRLPDGGWEWPLWEWKGAILQESGCAYGKFFKDKAAFISREGGPTSAITGGVFFLIRRWEALKKLSSTY